LSLSELKDRQRLCFATCAGTRMCEWAEASVEERPVEERTLRRRNLRRR
jgi:hypothetical protein